jgi:hypothetical protein
MVAASAATWRGQHQPELCSPMLDLPRSSLVGSLPTPFMSTCTGE